MMHHKSVFIGRWTYSMPDTQPDADGRMVLIKKRSFGPLEAYDWGIDENGLPYEEYHWCENDFFADENYFKHITKKELAEQIEALIRVFTEHGLSELAGAYQKALDRLNREDRHAEDRMRNLYEMKDVQNKEEDLTWHQPRRISESTS